MEEKLELVVPVDSPKVQFNRGVLLSAYDYQTSCVERDDRSGWLRVKPSTETPTFKTECSVLRVGCMLVGWGGNNGSTVTASVLANKQWRTRDGVKVAVRPTAHKTAKCIAQLKVH